MSEYSRILQTLDTNTYAAEMMLLIYNNYNGNVNSHSFMLIFRQKYSLPNFIGTAR